MTSKEKFSKTLRALFISAGGLNYNHAQLYLPTHARRMYRVGDKVISKFSSNNTKRGVVTSVTGRFVDGTIFISWEGSEVLTAHNGSYSSEHALQNIWVSADSLLEPDKRFNFGGVAFVDKYHSVARSDMAIRNMPALFSHKQLSHDFTYLLETGFTVNQLRVCSRECHENWVEGLKANHESAIERKRELRLEKELELERQRTAEGRASLLDQARKVAQGTAGEPALEHEEDAPLFPYIALDAKNNTYIITSESDEKEVLRNLGRVEIFTATGKMVEVKVQQQLHIHYYE